ncbi:prepilin-type N-terminal cleavage/methylation domain-containing protein [Priestia flexa]|jgi:competence protein ComGC|uniref:ComG operon protein 3 n=2 Tax=Priestia TaxID=2800373 RepID=A0A0V8JP89_9BACI|nr:MULTISPECIES: competence type IV pilus major pilin ComGC [Bacillaceae]AQX53761.1 competence protein ComG [Priestia flexa]KSU88432.1 competence protein ComG [Priestia veravalensis]KZB93122.1 competence protein ComG [Bacillus sp. VT 712]MBN8250394.1 prepilin-type N-terminal cleavage/methylation domain-containing protein [Priestia flexa]MBN8432784.1 prepilin-type N-terminal cleavage/methylation domain-containing protein [Priestia flexa]
MLKNEKGFTLIEMLIVMLVITVLLLIMVPNVLKHNAVINNKGCSALVKTVEAQVQVYELENGTKPTLNELESGGYLKEGTVCPNGSKITIGTDGRVSASDGNS